MDEMTEYKKKVEETVHYLQRRIKNPPRIILMLGTGLGSLVDRLDERITLPYADIPHFPRATVESHAGNLLFGGLAGQPLAILQGRFHYYEGYSTRELTLPVRVLALLGAEVFMVSNAAGGLNPGLTPGSLMIIRDHLNFIPDNPLRGRNIDAWGVRFPDLSQAYDHELIDRTIDCARQLQLASVITGVYAAIAGPSLETPTETRYLRSCGADAVGMSTVPEVIVARHAGLRVLGISVIANVNDPDNFRPIILEDVLAGTRQAAADFERLVVRVISGM